MNSLQSRLAELAVELGDIKVAGDGEYSRSGAVFALNPSAGVVEFKLGPEIAEAALRTPDTHESSRGDAWVRFTPKAWDDMAADRVDAWFRVAWKFAAR